jgi:hypothetical protein
VQGDSDGKHRGNDTGGAGVAPEVAVNPVKASTTIVVCEATATASNADTTQSEAERLERQQLLQ